MDDWIRIHVADFFGQLVEEIKERLARNPNPFIFAITIQDLQYILARYPGSKRGKNYKLWRDPFGNPLTYTPPDVTNEDLIQFSEEVIKNLGLDSISPDMVWQIQENQRCLVITALLIVGLMKKIPLKEVPTEIKFQVKKPEKDTFRAVLTGTFYLRPYPSEPPFVKVGDIIEEGQPLCILETNKVFNQILADKKMRILEIVAQDGSLVQAGDILFRIEIL